MTEIIDWLRQYWRYALIGMLIVGLGGFWYWHQQQEEAAATASLRTQASSAAKASSSASKRAATVTSSSQRGGYVYVSGAIRHPGLYHVDGRTRWADVVQAAGGLTKDADVAQINLAKVAKDEENLAIPAHGASQAAPTVAATSGTTGRAPAAAATPSGAETVINLNTATETELQTISGVGPKRAADIIAYRDAHGGFKAVTALKEVSGIGDKIFATIEPHVTVGP